MVLESSLIPAFFFQKNGKSSGIAALPTGNGWSFFVPLYKNRPYFVQMYIIHC